jgi:hypothetical protein
MPDNEQTRKSIELWKANPRKAFSDSLQRIESIAAGVDGNMKKLRKSAKEAEKALREQGNSDEKAE